MTSTPLPVLLFRYGLPLGAVQVQKTVSTSRSFEQLRARAARLQESVLSRPRYVAILLAVSLPTIWIVLATLKDDFCNEITGPGSDEVLCECSKHALTLMEAMALVGLRASGFLEVQQRRCRWIFHVLSVILSSVPLLFLAGVLAGLHMQCASMLIVTAIGAGITRRSALSRALTGIIFVNLVIFVVVDAFIEEHKDHVKGVGVWKGWGRSAGPFQRKAISDFQLLAASEGDEGWSALWTALGHLRTSWYCSLRASLKLF